MVDMNRAITQLDEEWDEENGFFGKLRDGIFDRNGLARVVTLLESIEEARDIEYMDRRFVSLTWYIPLFLNWQEERVQERGGSVQDLRIGTNRIISLLESILGVP